MTLHQIQEARIKDEVSYFRESIQKFFSKSFQFHSSSSLDSLSQSKSRYRVFYGRISKVYDYTGQNQTAKILYLKDVTACSPDNTLIQVILLDTCAFQIDNANVKEGDLLALLNPKLSKHPAREHSTLKVFEQRILYGANSRRNPHMWLYQQAKSNDLIKRSLQKARGFFSEDEDDEEDEDEDESQATIIANTTRNSIAQHKNVPSTCLDSCNDPEKRPKCDIRPEGTVLPINSGKESKISENNRKKNSTKTVKGPNVSEPTSVNKCNSSENSDEPQKSIDPPKDPTTSKQVLQSTTMNGKRSDASVDKNYDKNRSTVLSDSSNSGNRSKSDGRLKSPVSAINHEKKSEISEDNRDKATSENVIKVKSFKPTSVKKQVPFLNSDESDDSIDQITPKSILRPSLINRKVPDTSTPTCHGFLESSDGPGNKLESDSELARTLQSPVNKEKESTSFEQTNNNKRVSFATSNIYHEIELIYQEEKRVLRSMTESRKEPNNIQRTGDEECLAADQADNFDKFNTKPKDKISPKRVLKVILVKEPEISKPTSDKESVSSENSGNLDEFTTEPDDEIESKRVLRSTLVKESKISKPSSDEESLFAESSDDLHERRVLRSTIRSEKESKVRPHDSAGEQKSEAATKCVRQSRIENGKESEVSDSYSNAEKDSVLKCSQQSTKEKRNESKVPEHISDKRKFNLRSSPGTSSNTENYSETKRVLRPRKKRRTKSRVPEVDSSSECSDSSHDSENNLEKDSELRCTLQRRNKRWMISRVPELSSNDDSSSENSDNSHDSENNSEKDLASRHTLRSRNKRRMKSRVSGFSISNDSSSENSDNSHDSENNLEKDLASRHTRRPRNKRQMKSRVSELRISNASSESSESSHDSEKHLKKDLATKRTLRPRNKRQMKSRVSELRISNDSSSESSESSHDSEKHSKKDSAMKRTRRPRKKRVKKLKVSRYTSDEDESSENSNGFNNNTDTDSEPKRVLRSIKQRTSNENQDSKKAQFMKDCFNRVVSPAAFDKQSDVQKPVQHNESIRSQGSINEFEITKLVDIKANTKIHTIVIVQKELKVSSKYDPPNAIAEVTVTDDSIFPKEMQIKISCHEKKIPVLKENDVVKFKYLRICSSNNKLHGRSSGEVELVDTHRIIQQNSETKGTSSKNQYIFPDEETKRILQLAVWKGLMDDIFGLEEPIPEPKQLRNLKREVGCELNASNIPKESTNHDEKNKTVKRPLEKTSDCASPQLMPKVIIPRLVIKKESIEGDPHTSQVTIIPDKGSMPDVLKKELIVLLVRVPQVENLLSKKRKKKVPSKQERRRHLSRC